MNVHIAKKIHTLPLAYELAPEVARWLCASGDVDDFIYYDQEPKSSER